MDLERELICNELLNPSFEEFIKTTKFNYVAKCSKLSIKARQEGNQLYIKNDHTIRMHEGIFNLYSKSIAFALEETEELALGYGNRSAFLLHLKKYRESIQDIDRAVNITTSDSLKVKLLCRKVECLTALSSSENQIIFKNAVKYFNKIGRNDNDKESLSKIVRKTKNILDSNEQKTVLKERDEKSKFLKDLCLKTLSEKEKADPFSSVAVRYSKKYGRYLVATRDFKPGEIIYVEKPYAVCSNIKIPYMYCSHCLAVAWTGIPCKSCSWCIFCSKKCRDEAWKKYHDIECMIVPYMKELNKNLAYNFQLSIRVMIMGIKESGGIDQLKTELKHVDENTDELTRGFSKDGKFESNNFKSVYSLSHSISEEHFKLNVQATAIVLACVAKYTSFFGTNLFFKENQPLSDLTKDQNVLFIGALLLRLIKISCANRYSVYNSLQVCKHSSRPLTCLIKKCCSKGVCFAPLSSLINNSCIANARRCFTENQKIVIYAIEPIDKNSQIFDIYLCGFYESPNIIDRKVMLKDHFYFDCDCVACERNWPPLLNPPKEAKENFLNAPRSFLERQFIDENKEVIVQTHKKNAKLDETTIPLLVKGIVKATKLLPQPCTIRCILMFSLQKVFEKLYGYDVQIFHNCQN